jgi:hypothetical protein
MAETEKTFEKVTKIRVTNVSRRGGGAGRFLDPGEKYGNKLIGPGYSMIFDIPDGVMPDVLEVWGKDAAVHNASSGELLAGPIAGELSPAQLTPARAASASEDDPFGNEEDDIDLTDARDAFLPGNRQPQNEPMRAITPDTRQHSGQAQRAKITLGTRDEEHVGQDISPIPGDRPRSVDDSDKFTVKAPRSHAVGSVIGKK